MLGFATSVGWTRYGWNTACRGSLRPFSGRWLGFAPLPDADERLALARVSATATWVFAPWAALTFVIATRRSLLCFSTFFKMF